MQLQHRATRACDLPQPLSPTRPSVSPSPIVKLTPSTARSARALAGKHAARRARKLRRADRGPRAAARCGHAARRRARHAAGHATCERSHCSELRIACAQRATARAQRVAKRAARRQLREVGQHAGDRRERCCARSASMRGTLASSPCVYGWRGAANKRRRSGASPRSVRRTSPAIAVRHAGDHAQVVRDQEHAMPRSRLQLAASAPAPAPARSRRRAVVGSSAISSSGLQSERHRDHHALAHAAGELVRIAVAAPLGIGDAHALKQLDARARARTRGPCARAAPAPRSSWRATVSNGLSEVIGSWNTIAMRCRAAHAGCGHPRAATPARRSEPGPSSAARARPLDSSISTMTARRPLGRSAAHTPRLARSHRPSPGRCALEISKGYRLSYCEVLPIAPQIRRLHFGVMVEDRQPAVVGDFAEDDRLDPPRLERKRVVRHGPELSGARSSGRDRPDRPRVGRGTRR